MTTPMTPPADAVARLTKLADDYASRGDFATEDDIRTLLAAYADAARDRELLARVSACKGFDVAYHFLADPPVWVVTDTNLDDEEYEAPTLAEALAMLADKYAARTGEAR